MYEYKQHNLIGKDKTIVVKEKKKCFPIRHPVTYIQLGSTLEKQICKRG